MKNVWGFSLAAGLVCVLLITGCQKKQAQSSTEAIEHAKTLSTVEEKIDYLESQADLFYKSQQYKDAIDVSQHILKDLDAKSAEAKSTLDKAKSKLTEQVGGLDDKMKGLAK